jgi:hypothetical protein
VRLVSEGEDARVELAGFLQASNKRALN